MRRWTAQTLLLASYVVFLGSVLLSARQHAAGKPLDIPHTLISDLLSPSDNPNGHLIASVGIGVCGMLLLPIARLFYRTQSRAGGAIFALGPLCAIGELFFAADIDTVHVYLAFGAYIFMTAGLLICFAAAPRRSARTILAAGALAGILELLIYLLFTPRQYNVAACEWLLCIVLAAFTTGLAARDATIGHHARRCARS
jgi:hypothetical membrane protein